jgi:hypothetical protein
LELELSAGAMRGSSGVLVETGWRVGRIGLGTGKALEKLVMITTNQA